ncbi:MAG: GTP-binding protein [Synechococcales bacterium]|nr:GTP-binding protein [Synechococcales bacterium]
MRLPRSLLFLLGVIVILGMVIWLISALANLSTQVAAYSWLGQVLIALVILLLAMLLAALVYYLFLLPQHQKQAKAKRRQPPQAPQEKTEAAIENLKAVQQQVDQIQDEVVRQELLMRSRDIQQTLAQGELTIVVFGTGSAGKTSLVNAMIGRIVGQVGAPMGTTEVGATYRLKLPGIDREIMITDTPGILEVGIAGTGRETLAKKLATEADLLLFVVDNDLRQSEFEPLQMLARIGKRSILVLNKSDRYTEADQALLLGQLRQRVRSFISSTEVICVSANPAEVTLETGERVKPEPDILPLLRQIAAILRAEGEDLLADNILLQSQRLGEETRRILEAQRRRQAEKVVDRFQWIGAGVIAVTPVPVVDLLATAAVNAQMVVELGKVYGCEINPERGRELAFSLAKTLVSLGIVKGVISLVAAVLQISIVGLIVGRAIQGISAAYLTRIAGRSFIEYFRQDQDWGDGGMAEVVQQQFQLNRRDEFVKEFVRDAIDRVVKPLKLEAELEDSPFIQSEKPGQPSDRPPLEELDEWQRP